MCEIVSALALDKLLASPSVLQRMMVYDSLRSILVVLRLLFSVSYKQCGQKNGLFLVRKYSAIIYFLASDDARAFLL
jgi:hypothetical protein